MKALLLLVGLLIVPSFAQAQTPVSKETANAYFTNCTKVAPTEQFSRDSQSMFCACTAARMTQFFTMEDWLEIVNRGPNLREADNRMLINVTAPCLEEPVRAHYYNTCAADPNTATYGNPQKICTCLGNEMGAYVKVHAPRLFTEALQQDPNVSDPMVYLLTNPDFQKFSQSKLLSCLK